MGMGHLIGVDDEHLAVSGHDLHAHMRELVQDVKDGRRRLLAVQRRAVQHRLGGEIIQQRPVTGDGRQRQADVPQRRADGLRRAARCHREKPPMPVYSWMTARLQAGMPSLAVSSVLSISQITRVSLRGGFMRDVPS